MFRIAIFRMVASRNFARFLLNICIASQSWQLQINISKIGCLTERSVKCQSAKCKTVYEILTSRVTLPNLLGDVMSSISRHRPSFKSFWWAQLKTALYKDQTADFTKIWSTLYWLLAQKISYYMWKYIDWTWFSLKRSVS